MMYREDGIANENKPLITNRNKTKKMRNVEAKWGKPLQELLPDKVTTQGLSATANEFGVSKATLGYWLLKLDIIVARIALAPGESITINRNQPQSRVIASTANTARSDADASD